MPKINREEYEILKALDGYTHLARDKNRFRDKSLLQAYQIKPKRKEYLWVNPNNTDVEDLDENLFQFIQWEDEEPYSIAELIEEYESSQMTYFDNNLVKELDDFIEESEETEVKNIQWLKEAIKEYAYANYGNRMKIDISGEELDSLINQLDEPEVLSQEWIDKHAEYYEGRLYIWKRDLQNLLVPKQELPVIPKYVADYINRKKKGGNSLDGAFSYIKAYGWDDESSYDYEVYKWLDIGSNDETFARAWLDGYEVEEEQKYYVIDEHNVFLLAEDEERNKVETVAKLVEIYGYEQVELNYQLTEQEIKDYDTRYWAFRKPVEELEEC